MLSEIGLGHLRRKARGLVDLGLELGKRMVLAHIFAPGEGSGDCRKSMVEFCRCIQSEALTFFIAMIGIFLFLVGLVALVAI